VQNFLHYCQHYRIPSEQLVFWKRDVAKDIFSCDTQPLALPPQVHIHDQIHNYIAVESG
jgi:hypothetical protein